MNLFQSIILIVYKYKFDGEVINSYQKIGYATKLYKLSEV